MSQTAATSKQERLSIRANAQQKALLARAAGARHMNVSQFVLQTSLQSAQQIIEQETQIVVSAEEYEWLLQKLEEPPQENLALRRLLKEKPVWENAE